MGNGEVSSGIWKMTMESAVVSLPTPTKMHTFIPPRTQKCVLVRGGGNQEKLVSEVVLCRGNMLGEQLQHNLIWKH